MIINEQQQKIIDDFAVALREKYDCRWFDYDIRLCCEELTRRPLRDSAILFASGYFEDIDIPFIAVFDVIDIFVKEIFNQVVLKVSK